MQMGDKLKGNVVLHFHKDGNIVRDKNNPTIPMSSEFHSSSLSKPR